MKTMLILGCWGRTEEGFCTCNGVSNQILEVSIQSEQMRKVSNYLDTVLNLYDRPLYNNIHTALFNIQDKFSEKTRPIFRESVFRRMEDFCLMHAKCGAYLRLELVE
jgi:hypothetical protein